MRKNKLGKTDMTVTQIGFGAMELRGVKTWDGRDISEDEAEAILNAVLDAGVNFIDTSPDYGLSEEFIGRYIADRRKEFFLATKCGCNPRDMGDHIETSPHIWTHENIMQNIQRSLDHMKCDYVDLLQLHNPKPEEVLRFNVVQTLKDIQAQGMTRFIGISTTLPYIDDFLAMGVFDTFQLPYSCMDMTHRKSIGAIAAAGAGTIIRGGIAQGGPASESFQENSGDLWQTAALEEFLEDIDPSELILRYTLTHPDIDTVIVGTSRPEHLHRNIQSAERGALPRELYDEITRRLAVAMERIGII
ncbi:MAG: aldo/keto reductase [Planctomycetaceae bacterium]|nr:MAG: aldo/keto reductase [Planctomycetaceae bacterium]